MKRKTISIVIVTYNAEKMLREHGDKVDEDLKKEVEGKTQGTHGECT